MPVPSDQRRQLTAQRDRSFRYFAGKPVGAIDPDEWTSEEEDDEVEEEQVPAQKSKPTSKSVASKLPEGFITAVDIEESRREAEEKRRREQEEEAEFETESEDDGDPGRVRSSEQSGSEEESSPEESESSSDDEPRSRRQNIMLLSRSQREAMQSRNGGKSVLSAPKKLTEDEQWELEEKLRKQRADALLEEQRAAQRARRENARKQWDDEDPELEDDIDDTDPQPGTENYEKELEEALARWKLRELHRVKRDRDALLAREKELDELERRRNMTPAERAAEERQKLEEEREGRDSRGKMAYMQKYFHKGAFFTEDLEGAGLAKREVMGARFQDSTDRSVLPQYMQIRDMEKLGKKSHTKYRDMKSEDTGQFGGYLGDRRTPKWGDDWRRRDEKRGPDDRFLDERFKPDEDDRRPYGRGRWEQDERGATGANARPLGDRKRFGEDSDRRERQDKRPRVS